MKKLVLVSLLLLQSCTSAPPTQFYSLESIAVPTVLESANKKPLIGIAQISLPSALERKQIVTRDRQGQLILAEQHQWAAVLKQNMTEVLAKNLATQQPEFWFKSYPWSAFGAVDYRLVIEVTRLDIVLGKTIHFSVEWTLLNEKLHTVLQHSTVDLNLPLADDNYKTAVNAINQLLVQLSSQKKIHLSE